MRVDSVGNTARSQEDAQRREAAAEPDFAGWEPPPVREALYT
jgi:hypothetical protein